MTVANQLVQTHRHRVPVLQAGEGRPLLYLHSYEGPLPAGAAALAELAVRHKLLAPTHPGFDGTEADPSLADVHNVVVLYLELLDQLGLDEVDVLGHSLGAMFAAELAAVAPHRIRRLVLVSPLGIWSDANPTPDVLAAGGPALLRMTWADPSSEQAIAASKAPMIERTANVAMAGNYLWPLPDRGLESRIHRLTMPTLVVR
ncbi:MAG: alpha/beta fold hydrolase, partial [Hyphomicrobiales bacterium]